MVIDPDDPLTPNVSLLCIWIKSSGIRSWVTQYFSKFIDLWCPIQTNTHSVSTSFGSTTSTSTSTMDATSLNEPRCYTYMVMPCVIHWLDIDITSSRSFGIHTLSLGLHSLATSWSPDLLNSWSLGSLDHLMHLDIRHLTFSLFLTFQNLLTLDILITSLLTHLHLFALLLIPIIHLSYPSTV